MPVLPFKGVLHDALPFMHAQMPTMDGRRGACSDVELNCMECLEAYGAIKGMHKCAKYIEDLQECKYMKLQQARAKAMWKERMKQVAYGKRAPKDYFVEPVPYDAYVYGTFWP